MIFKSSPRAFHVIKYSTVPCFDLQGSYGSLKSMKVQDILAVKIMYLKVLNFQETVEKSIKVHIKRVLLLINNYVCYFAGASFEAIVCKKIFCGGKSHSCRRRPIILPASRSFPANRSISANHPEVDHVSALGKHRLPIELSC